MCPSRDEDVAAVNSDLRELDQVSVLLLAGGSERIEKCVALVSKYDKNALSPTIRSMQVDVCLSPTGCLDTVPACLTPSEWQSVNDMPRVNRLPLTQRITPLKDRVRDGTKSVEKMHRSRANAIECTKFVTSSSCSSVSAAMCKIALENTTDDDFVPLGFYKTNCSSEEIGQGNACEEEDNYHSRHSDISNGDIPSVGDVEYSGEYCLRRKYRAESDGSLTSNLHSLCGEDNGIDTENEDGSDGESDSDNDLGHFYSPHINSSNLPVSGVAPESASLGYISSYPSVSISRSKHPNAF